MEAQSDNTKLLRCWQSVQPMSHVRRMLPRSILYLGLRAHIPRATVGNCVIPRSNYSQSTILALAAGKAGPMGVLYLYTQHKQAWELPPSSRVARATDSIYPFKCFVSLDMDCDLLIAQLIQRLVVQASLNPVGVLPSPWHRPRLDRARDRL